MYAHELLASVVLRAREYSLGSLVNAYLQTNGSATRRYDPSRGALDLQSSTSKAGPLRSGNFPNSDGIRSDAALINNWTTESLAPFRRWSNVTTQHCPSPTNLLPIVRESTTVVPPEIRLKLSQEKAESQPSETLFVTANPWAAVKAIFCAKVW